VIDFKTDENLPVDVADLIRQRGHSALTVIDQQLSGHADTDVARVCQSEQRALITLDLDFSDIRAYPPENYFGIIVLRPAMQTIAAILRLSERALMLVGTEPLIGQLWIVDESRVRIRDAGTP
jgi:predicted nuclease of predicted toxin-antitoxin system